MDFKIKDNFGNEVTLRPSVGLYDVSDFMGIPLVGLAIALDEVDENGDFADEYAILTTSFGEFISIKNSAYIDVNNCPFAQQLLDYGIAEETRLYKSSGFCKYPLWVFNEDFLRECGGEEYKEYSDIFDGYYQSLRDGSYLGNFFDDDEYADEPDESDKAESPDESEDPNEFQNNATMQ